MSAVTLEAYTPAWPAAFDHAATELSAALAGAAGLAIEHIGSTAVPGLCAKPVVDVLVGASGLEVFGARMAALQALGYRYRPQHEAAIPHRRYFVRAPGGHPKVHVHGVVLGGTLWREHIVFRDALRRDALLAAEYAALKRRLAREHAHDKAAYTLAKAPFIQHVLRHRGAP